MPSLPRPQCDHYQCKAPSVKGSRYCEVHTQSKAPTIDRQTFNARYKTAAWESIRQRQLSVYPLCAACLLRGQVTSASHVDHVFPWQAIGPHAFTLNLFQSLCPECHGVKSGAEKRGAFVHYTDKAHEYTAQDYPSAMMNAWALPLTGAQQVR
jgi:5-methylcytosine-specific restriction endonuclease McrA